jgi:hypothetical protein
MFYVLAQSYEIKLPHVRNNKIIESGVVNYY